MEIFEVRGERERFRDLLLFADTSWEMVMRYLPHGFMLAAREGDAVLGEIVTVPVEAGWEIKNLAVADPFHRRGIGGALVRAALARLPDGAAVWVGTGDFPSTVGFYESCGFKRSHVVKNFFTDNYPEPIYEGDSQCVDMLYLTQVKGACPAGPYETGIEGCRIRFAGTGDLALILDFIKKLAEYEGMLGEVVATEDLLREWIFEKRKAEVLIAEKDGAPAGFALFFHNFSTFLGRAGLYLEDLFVLPGLRGAGIGKALLARLAALAVERGCGRVEWWCLDWNRPSIGFYRSLGARAMDDWTVYRLTGDAMKALAETADG